MMFINFHKNSIITFILVCLLPLYALAAFRNIETNEIIYIEQDFHNAHRLYVDDKPVGTISNQNIWKSLVYLDYFTKGFLKNSYLDYGTLLQNFLFLYRVLGHPNPLVAETITGLCAIYGALKYCQIENMLAKKWGDNLRNQVFSLGAAAPISSLIAPGIEFVVQHGQKTVLMAPYYGIEGIKGKDRYLDLEDKPFQKYLENLLQYVDQ